MHKAINGLKSNNHSVSVELYGSVPNHSGVKGTTKLYDFLKIRYLNVLTITFNWVFLQKVI